MTLAVAEQIEDAGARAAGSSFYLAMRLMPLKQRQAMFEIYSFCRAVDDIADNDGPREVRLRQLQRWRADIDAIYAGTAAARLRTLAQSVATFNLRREEFQAVIDGMEMDVLGTVAGANWAQLDVYCDRVASAVGRLSVRIFGMPDVEGLALAHHLGRALQLTNILRDLDEDAAMGRLYLPEEALCAAQILTRAPKEVVASPKIAAACAPLVAQAEMHFRQSDVIFAACSRASVRTPRIMASAYRLILSQLVARGWTAPRAPVKLRRSRMFWILLRCLAP